jgi:hypothetical protein
MCDKVLTFNQNKEGNALNYIIKLAMKDKNPCFGKPVNREKEISLLKIQE